jgi:hypothetical protein
MDDARATGPRVHRGVPTGDDTDQRAEQQAAEEQLHVDQAALAQHHVDRRRAVGRAQRDVALRGPAASAAGGAPEVAMDERVGEIARDVLDGLGERDVLQRRGEEHVAERRGDQDGRDEDGEAAHRGRDGA